MENSIRFKCPTCEAQLYDFVYPPVPDDPAEERSETSGHGSTLLTCSECAASIKVEMVLTERGLDVAIDGVEGGIELVAAPNLFDSSPYDEYYARYLLPNNPEVIFIDSMKQISTLEERFIRSGILDDYLNRMLFTQYFAILEAYLCDRLIIFVDENRSRLAALIRHNKDWTKEAIPVLEMTDDEDPLFNWVKRKLQNFQYHNLGRVDHYYRGAFGVSIFPDENIKKRLMSFIDVRHDCVHRNGRDKDGNERRISRRDVEILAKALNAVFECIESVHRQYTSETKFPF